MCLKRWIYTNCFINEQQEETKLEKGLLDEVRLCSHMILPFPVRVRNNVSTIQKIAANFRTNIYGKGMNPHIPPAID